MCILSWFHYCRSLTVFLAGLEQSQTFAVVVIFKLHFTKLMFQVDYKRLSEDLSKIVDMRGILSLRPYIPVRPKGIFSN